MFDSARLSAIFQRWVRPHNVLVQETSDIFAILTLDLASRPASLPKRADASPGRRSTAFSVIMTYSTVLFRVLRRCDIHSTPCGKTICLLRSMKRAA